jgi:hypothetical protein
MISQEQATEYKQVAGLVCLDLDILLTVAEAGDVTMEDLISQIRYTHQKKELLIADPKERQDRYNACSLVFAMTER